MQFYLYRHIRLDTGLPFYVGIGKKDPKQIMGWRTEYKRAFTSNKRSFLWKRIVNKHGYEVEIMYECDTEFEIKEKEKEFIKLYGRLDNDTGILTNYTDGADGRLGATSESLKRNIEILKSKTGVNHPGSKKVFKYDLDGNFVKGYDCINDAKKELNLSSGAAISACCKKNIHCHTYKNYFWFYEYQGEKIPPLPKNFHSNISAINGLSLSKKVAKLDKDTNEILEIFNSTMDVQRKYNYCNPTISACCLGKQKNAYGYKWKYI